MLSLQLYFIEMMQRTVTYYALYLIGHPYAPPLSPDMSRFLFAQLEQLTYELQGIYKSIVLLLRNFCDFNLDFLRFVGDYMRCEWYTTVYIGVFYSMHV